MLALPRTLVILGAALFAVVAAAADKPAEKRVALVIGNAAYKGSPLSNSVNDAKDMAAKLSRLGFEVILKTDVGLRDMSRAVTLFGQKLGEGSVALVYYAGHGIQAKGRNFLVPVDAEISQESSIRSEAVDADQVLEQLQPARVSVVILDACRNNPFERRFRSGGGGGLAQMDAPKGTLIAYATAPGKVAADGEGRNGLYTAELLRALDDPTRRIEDVFKQVRNNVAKATGDQQIPWESSSLTGDLYLAGRPSAATGATAQPVVQLATDPAAFEIEFWRSVEKGGKADDYRAYLAKYPQGQFADLARSRLGQAVTPVARQAAPEAQQDAAGGGAKRELEQAARLYKDGHYAEARMAFKRLLETVPAESPVATHASYGLGFAQAAEGMCAQAAQSLKHAAETWPDHGRAPQAWREIARCEQSLDHPFKAVRAARLLVEKYPSAPEAAWARKQLEGGEMRAAGRRR